MAETAASRLERRREQNRVYARRHYHKSLVRAQSCVSSEWTAID